jgi:hypothetical protein
MWTSLADRFCGLVVRVLGYRSGGPGSILGTIQKKLWVWKRFHSASWVQLRRLLKRKSSGSCLENREYGLRDPSRWLRGTLYPQKLAITSQTRGGRSVGIVRLRTQTMESYIYIYISLLEYFLRAIVQHWRHYVQPLKCHTFQFVLLWTVSVALSFIIT